MKNLIKATSMLALLAATPAVAWEPAKPVEIVVAAGAGGASDQMARMKRLGVVVSAQFQPYQGGTGMVRRWGRARAERAVTAPAPATAATVATAATDCRPATVVGAGAMASC